MELIFYGKKRRHPSFNHFASFPLRNRHHRQRGSQIRGLPQGVRSDNLADSSRWPDKLRRLAVSVLLDLCGQSLPGERGARPHPRNLNLMFYLIMVPPFGQLESFLLEFKPVSPGLGFCCYSDKMCSNHHLKTIMNLTLIFLCYIKQLSFLYF